MEEQLRILIDAFLQDVREVVKMMQREWGIEYPLHYRSHGIPKEGEVGGSYYCFHGIGCHVEYQGRVVDFNFGDGGRIDGFDLWRLSRYGERNEPFKQYAESSKLKDDFNQAVTASAFERTGKEWDHLYYLKT